MRYLCKVGAVGLALMSAMGASTASAGPLTEKYFPRECRDQQIAGAIIGGIAGAVLGDAVADKKNKQEGRVVGGTVGAVVGSQAGRATCEKKLRLAIARQVAEDGRPVTVPEGPLNPIMRGREVQAYVNKEQETCKLIRVTADESSTASEDVAVCLVDGKWRRRDA